MLGDDVVDSVRVVNHDARDAASLVWLGRFGADVPVWLNREWVDADVRITTGFVEPHFFAGFSGGPKMVAPGLAALETVLTLHDAKRIGHPNARWGVIDGNPVHDDVRAIAAATGTSFTLDVIIDAQHRLVRAYGGELDAAHRAACSDAMKTAMRKVPGRFDVVVTSNSGFPLDQNLYQSVKGMSAASQVVKPGGTIVCAAECRDGFPDHGGYRDQLAGAASAEALLQEIAARRETVVDQWQVQIQAAIQARARVVMHTSYLSDDELASAHLEQTNDVSATVGKRSPRRATERRSASSRRGRRRFPTSRDEARPRRAGQVPRVRNGSRGRAVDREGRGTGRLVVPRAAARRRRRGNARRPRRAQSHHPRHRAAGLAGRRRLEARRRARRDRDGARLRARARGRGRSQRSARRLDARHRRADRRRSRRRRDPCHRRRRRLGDDRRRARRRRSARLAAVRLAGRRRRGRV